MILRFLNSCPDDEYYLYVKRAKEYLDTLPANEKGAAKKQLAEIIATAAKQAEEAKTQSTSKHKDQNSLWQLQTPEVPQKYLRCFYA